jgi:hypothetical protein
VGGKRRDVVVVGQLRLLHVASQAPERWEEHRARFGVRGAGDVFSHAFFLVVSELDLSP